MESNEIVCNSNFHFSFLVGEESPYIYNTNNFFFHSKEFLKDQEVVSFYILNNKKKLCEGVFNLSVREHVGYSPLKAPFGSIDVNSSISPVILDEFLDIILKWSEEKQLSCIKIKHYPQCYDSAGSTLVQNLLYRKGFEISNLDIAQYIDISSDDTIFSGSARIKLKKCKKAGFVWEKISVCNTTEIFNLIKDCKDKKGYPMNMSLASLDLKLRRFPDNYLLFGVKDGEKLIGVSVCVVVTPTLLYDFSHAHHVDYQRYSPVIFLIEGICNYCKENDYRLLDLGLSTDQSDVNVGLYEFKNRLGTKPSAKASYLKLIN